METLIKYPNSEIILSKSENANLPADIEALALELDSVEGEVRLLTDDLARIDESINEFRQSCDNLAVQVSKIGTSIINAASNGDSSYAKGYLGMASLAIKGVGCLAEKVKKQTARKNYDIKVAELMSEKKQIAEEKLPHLNNQISKLSKLFEQVEKFHEKEFTVKADIEDKSIVSRILIYRKALCLTIKSRYLKHTMEYFAAEMEAWEIGENDSGMSAPNIVKEFDAEIRGWGAKLVPGTWTLDDFLLEKMKRADGEIPVPIATLLADPCLFRHFIGINFGKAGNCPSALIDFSGNTDFVKNPLVLGNIYYQHCQKVMDEKYRPPRKPAKFNLFDLMVLMVMPAIFFGLLFLIFKVEQSTGWRIFFMIPALCWTGCGIEYLESNYERFFPYVSRLSNYNNRYSKFKTDILDAENCQEVHVIG